MSKGKRTKAKIKKKQRRKAKKMLIDPRAKKHIEDIKRYKYEP